MTLGYLQNPVKFFMTLLQYSGILAKGIYDHMSYSILQHIVDKSNNYLDINQTMQKRFKILKVEELFCFLGLTLLMPRTKNLKLQEFWSRDSLIQTPVFGQIFAREGYFYILRVLHFIYNDLPTGNDPLYKIRPLLDHFAQIFKTAFTLLFYFRERPKNGGGQRSAGDTPLPGTSKGAPSKMTEQHRFGTTIAPITCHAWNKNRNQIAISPNNQEVHIYEKSGSEWKITDNLSQHDLRVMGIDWAPNTNRIVTCSADRNAYVWNQDADKKWKPTLVLLRINRAATCVKWSPDENKFAVGSGARLVSVCYFESENDWWVSKHIKKPLRSTVTALDWHPNNMLLVVGSTDFKVRVFSAHIKDIEKVPEPTPWGSKTTLGTLLAEFSNSSAGGGWVQSVSFSPDGNKVCWVAHDSTINVADASKGNATIKMRTEFLPFMSCTWITNNSIVAAGHSCIPVLYHHTENGLVFSAKLDASQKKETGGLSAMKMFHSLDKQARSEVSDTSILSIHQNAITCICLYNGTKSNCTKFSTSGLDGLLVIWDLNSLERAIQGLKIV